MTEQGFDVRSRTTADLAHHRAALADQDLLLALGLGVEAHVNALLVDLHDLRRQRVRDLFFVSRSACSRTSSAILASSGISVSVSGG